MMQQKNYEIKISGEGYNINLAYQKLEDKLREEGECLPYSIEQMTFLGIIPDNTSYNEYLTYKTYLFRVTRNTHHD